MVRADINGKMDQSMMDNTLMMKNMEKGNWKLVKSHNSMIGSLFME